MTKKIKKSKGLNDEGIEEFEEIFLTSAQEILYDLLVRIADKVNA